MLKRDTENKITKIAIFGRGNVGKTSTLNTIADINLHTSNVEGTTVEIKEVFTKINNQKFIFIDLPGIKIKKYNAVEKIAQNKKIEGEDIEGMGEEEILTIKFLEDKSNYDIILYIAKSNQIEKDIELMKIVSQFDKKVLIAFNFAEKIENIKNLNKANIEKFLNKEIIMIDSNTKGGILNLKDKILALTNTQETTQETTQKLNNKNKGITNKQFTNLSDSGNSKNHKADQNDKNKIELQALIKQTKEALSKDFSIQKQNKTSKNIDKIVMNKFLSIPILILVMSSMFITTFNLSDSISLMISQLSIKIIELINNSLFYINSNIFGQKFANIVSISITNGILPGVIEVIEFLPKILILTFWITIIEETGYIQRISLILNRFLSVFQIPPEGMPSIFSGFGCSVPAYISTRSLKNKSEKLITMIAISLIPCHAKMILFIFLANVFFGKNAGIVVIALYIIAIILAIILSKITAKIISYKPHKNINNINLFKRLQNYHIPNSKKIFNNLIERGKDYIAGTASIIVIFSFCIWALSVIPANFKNISKSIIENQYESVAIIQQYMKDKQSIKQSIEHKVNQTEIKNIQTKFNTDSKVMQTSALGFIGTKLSVIFKPMDFDWKVTASIVTAFFAKELSIATLGVLYSYPIQENKSIWTNLQNQISIPSAISYMIFMLIWVPCLSALATFWSENKNNRQSLNIIVINTLLTYVITLIVYKICYALII